MQKSGFLLTRLICDPGHDVDTIHDVRKMLVQLANLHFGTLFHSMTCGVVRSYETPTGNANIKWKCFLKINMSDARASIIFQK